MSFWIVTVNRKTNKAIQSLPKTVKQRLLLLIQEIELYGPVRGNWKNYSKLKSKMHHCHLKSGKPTYVAVWREKDSKIEIEVIYVGTHEKAPY